MTIFLIRHGQSEFNVVYETDGSDPMILDAPLTALGHAQARQAREKVANMNIKLVITSPLTRAIQTAQTIFHGIAPIRVMAGHRELVGHSCDIGRGPGQLQADFPTLSFDHLDDIWWHQGPVNETGVPIEPQDVFSARIARFREDLRALKDRPIAVVGILEKVSGFCKSTDNTCEVRPYTI